MGSDESSVDKEESFQTSSGSMNIEHYLKTTKFTKPQIQLLKRSYEKLKSKSLDGKIRSSDFVEQMGFPNKAIGEKLFAALDDDGNGDLDFDEFINGLNCFHPQSPFDKKAELCFNAYDDDGSGEISKDEIKTMIEVCLENNEYIQLTKAQLNTLLDELFAQYDDDGGGEINLKEFTDLVSKAPGIIECFNFNIEDLEEKELANNNK